MKCIEENTIKVITDIQKWFTFLSKMNLKFSVGQIIICL